MKPTNQASLASWLVPVLPAMARPSPAPAAWPLPCDTTPCIIVTNWNTLCGSAICGRASVRVGGLAGSSQPVQATPVGRQITWPSRSWIESTMDGSTSLPPIASPA